MGATGEHGHAPAPTPSPSRPPLPVLALGSQSASQSVGRSRQHPSYADDSPACSLPPIHPIPEGDNATGTGTRVPAAMQLVLYPTRSAVACRKNKAICTVPSCTVHIHCGSWLAGGGDLLQSSTRESNYGRNTGRHPLSDPARKASPGTRQTLSARTVAQQTRAACSTDVQYMHVCTSTRLTNCIVSSRYQITYRGHRRQALVSNLLTFHSRFPRPSMSPRRSAGRVICQCQSRPLGFQRPLDCRLLVPARRRHPPSPRNPGWGRLDETPALSVQRARNRGISQA